MPETWVRSLGQKDTLEKEMATHSSNLAWKIPSTEEPGGLQSVECSFRGLVFPRNVAGKVFGAQALNLTRCGKNSVRLDYLCFVLGLPNNRG